MAERQKRFVWNARVGVAVAAVAAVVLAGIYVTLAGQGNGGVAAECVAAKAAGGGARSVGRRRGGGFSARARAGKALRACLHGNRRQADDARRFQRQGGAGQSLGDVVRPMPAGDAGARPAAGGARRRRFCRRAGLDRHRRSGAAKGISRAGRGEEPAALHRPHDQDIRGREGAWTGDRPAGDVPPRPQRLPPRPHQRPGGVGQRGWKADRGGIEGARRFGGRDGQHSAAERAELRTR